MSAKIDHVPKRELLKINVITFLFMMYFLFAPMEDILTGSIGTVAKYIAILIMLMGIIQNHGKIYFNSEETTTRCVLWLMFISVMSIIWSISRETTLHRLTAYLLVPGFCIFTNTFDLKKGDYEKIVSAAIIGGVIASVVAYIKGDFLAGRMILTETNDPNNFAALIFLPAALAWDRTQNGGSRQRIINAAAFVLFSFIILYTGSRGGLLSLLVMVIVYFLVSGKTKNVKVLLDAILLLLLIWRFVLPLLPTEIILRMLNPSNYSSTASRRTIIWGFVVNDIIPHMPICGLGAGTVSIELAKYYGKINGVHNTYLNMIGEFGLFGLPAFAVMIVSIIRKALKNKSPLYVALLAGICVTIFFLDSFAKKFFWNVILLFIIQSNTVDENDNAT